MKYLKRYNESVLILKDLESIFYDLSDNDYSISIKQVVSKRLKDKVYGKWILNLTNQDLGPHLRSVSIEIHNKSCFYFNDIKETLLFAIPYIEETLKLKLEWISLRKGFTYHQESYTIYRRCIEDIKESDNTLTCITLMFNIPNKCIVE